MTKFLKYCVALVLFALMADMAVGQTERSEVEYRSPYIDLRPVKCVQTSERQNGVEYNYGPGTISYNAAILW